MHTLCVLATIAGIASRWQVVARVAELPDRRALRECSRSVQPVAIDSTQAQASARGRSGGGKFFLSTSCYSWGQ